MAMVPVRSTTLQRRPTAPAASKESGSAIRLMVESDFPVENNDQNRRLMAFLMADLKSSWHPSFNFLTSVIRNIAHSLVAVSAQELADMKVVCCVDNRSMHGNQRQDWTIRGAADQCRKLCGVAILETQNGMDIIDRESRELHGSQGPLNRLMREMVSGDVSERAMMEHVQKARTAHDLIVAQQSMSVRRWHDLNHFVSSVSSSLYDQLQTLETRKTQLRRRRTAVEEAFKALGGELQIIEETESAVRSGYQDVLDINGSTATELRKVKTELRELKDQIPLFENLLEELNEDIKLGEPKLREEKEAEEERRKAMDKETEGQRQTYAGMLYDYCWSGVTERRNRAQWDRDMGERSRQLDEKKKESDELVEKIRKLKYGLKRLELKMKQLQNATSAALADEHENEPAVRRLQRKADEKRPEVNRLKAELEQIDAEMAKIKKYEEVVPGLSREFREMENHVLWTYNGHRHNLRKLNDFSSKFASIAKRTSTWNGNDAKYVMEDTLGLRGHYIVIQFMSRACGFVCRELFADGFLAISHLGTEPSPHEGASVSSPRGINHETANQDIDNIYRHGERIARGFDNVTAGRGFGDGKIADKFREAQNDCFFTLRHAINDVAESTPPRSLWPGTSSSRFLHWTKRKRQQAIEDWATTVLGEEGQASNVMYELSGEQEAAIAELPGTQHDR